MANTFNFTGRSPNEILDTTVVNSSSWHFFQALSWLDYAKRSQAPSAIHYAAFDLRYGIEYILFELVTLTSENFTRAEYEKCLGDPGEMKKMMFANSPNYSRLCEFTKMALAIDSGGLNLRFWDIKELFRYWGIASSYLHFVGIKNMEWLIESIAELESVLNKIWNEVTAETQTLGVGLFRPAEMEPEVHDAWIEYLSNRLSNEDLHLRLKLMQPAIRARTLKRLQIRIS